MRSDLVSIQRLITYIGPREWVEETVARSVQGTKAIGKSRRICGVTLTTFPTVLLTAEEIRQLIEEKEPA